ncbi:MAG: divergent PAP2 family protein [Oscillospiraceae bacterium]
MGNFVHFLTGNLVLNLCILSWFAAQVLKVIIYYIRNRRLDFHYLLSSGGMPSSHSSVVCTCATSVGRLAGWSSFSFAIATVLAFIVMYDAANVRKAAGEQARILNYIMDHWKEMRPEFLGKELKELLGHTPLQVFAGAVLGILIGLLGTYLCA